MNNNIINELEQIEPSAPLDGENGIEQVKEQVKKQFRIRFYELEAFDEMCEQFRPTINKAYYLTYALDRKSKERFTGVYVKLLFKGVKKCRKNGKKLRQRERRAERQARRAKRRAERKKRSRAQKLL